MQSEPLDEVRTPVRVCDLGRCRDSVRSYFKRHLWRGRTADAEDLAQDTVLVIWRATSPGAERSVHSLRGFIAATARHKLVDHVRRVRGRHERALLEKTVHWAASGASAPSPEIQLGQRELHRRLATCIGRLDDPERSMIVLSYFGEGGHAEACRALGLSSAQGSRLKYRALEHLRFSMRARAARRGR